MASFSAMISRMIPNTRHETPIRCALLTSQALALAPVFRQHKLAPPQAALVFPRNDLPFLHARMARDRPPAADQFNLKLRLSNKAIPAQSIGALGPGETRHQLIADQFLEKLRRFLAAGIESVADQAFLVRLWSVDGSV